MADGRTIFRIVARHSGKCLDVARAGRANGDPIHQWEYVGAENQHWTIDHVESTWYKLVARHSGKCLDVILASNVSEAAAHQWDYVGAANQQWEITPVNEVHCKLTARHSGQCLQVGGTSLTANGSQVNQLRYVDGENQQWQLVPDLAAFPDLRDGSVVRDGSHAFAIANGTRVLLPDDDSRGLREERRTDWKDVPLWPFLHDACGACDERASYPLIRVLTRAALRGGTAPEISFAVGGRSEWESGRVSVFLSHSGRDRALAHRLADDLRQNGIAVWIDASAIRVGDSISHEIQTGLQQTDFVAVLLTRASTESGWVEKEWQSRIADEAEQHKVFVLPVKAEECTIPPLLRDRKVADLTRDYESGVRELVAAIRRNREDAKPAEPSSPLRWITEGGTSALFFSITNETYGPGAVLNSIWARAYQAFTYLAGVPRTDLASLVENAEILGPERQAAINLSNGDLFILAREVVTIEPGSVVPFSLRLCCRGLDAYTICRLAARLLDDRGRQHIVPSDCVYLLRAADTYSTGATYLYEALRRLLIRAAVPVADVLRTPLRVYQKFSEYTGESLGTYYVIQVEGDEYEIPEEYLTGTMTSNPALLV